MSGTIFHTGMGSFPRETHVPPTRTGEETNPVGNKKDNDKGCCQTVLDIAKKIYRFVKNLFVNLWNAIYKSFTSSTALEKVDAEVEEIVAKEEDKGLKGLLDTQKEMSESLGKHFEKLASLALKELRSKGASECPLTPEINEVIEKVKEVESRVNLREDEKGKTSFPGIIRAGSCEELLEASILGKEKLNKGLIKERVQTFLYSLEK